LEVTHSALQDASHKRLSAVATGRTERLFENIAAEMRRAGNMKLKSEDIAIVEGKG